MTARTEPQIISGPDGEPAFVVIPYKEYARTHPREDLIPNEVMGYIIMDQMNPIKAWRKYLDLTQTQMAERMGISQAAYGKMEKAERPRRATREKIANALGINPNLLD